jgi:hypothetical protein
MAALPEPLHTRKPNSRPSAPKTDQYDRDPNSPSERTRASSNYNAGTGYAPFYHSFLADLPRLSSGNACTLLILTILSKSLGRGAKKGEPRPTATLPVAISDLAQICRCDERTIERELAGLKARKIAKVEPAGKGKVSVELLYRTWRTLPDYKSNVVSIDGSEDEDEAKDESKAKEATRVELTKRPQPARAGKSSRSIPVRCGVKAFRFQNDSVVDLSFTAVVQAGELVLSSQVPDAWMKTAAKRIAQSNGINNLTSATRHGRREPFASPSPKPGDKSGSEGKAKQGSTSQNQPPSHPRADEICNLFDPILLKSQSRLLSADPKALSEACQAVGSTDHDFLVHFVMTRAARPINSPSHVKHIVAEAARNWEKVRNLPVGQRIPAKPQQKAGFVESTKAEILRRLQKGTF